MVRLRSELRCAIECVAKYEPDALLMDGSLLPLPNDRPPQGSELGPLFEKYNMSLLGPPLRPD